MEQLWAVTNLIRKYIILTSRLNSSSRENLALNSNIYLSFKANFVPAVQKQFMWTFINNIFRPIIYLQPNQQKHFDRVCSLNKSIYENFCYAFFLYLQTILIDFLFKKSIGKKLKDLNFVPRRVFDKFLGEYEVRCADLRDCVN